MKLSNNEVQQRTKGSGIDGDNFDMLVLESMNRKLMRHLDRLNDLPVQTVLLGNNIQHYQDQYDEQDRLFEIDSTQGGKSALPTQGGSVSMSNVSERDDMEEQKEEYWFKKSTSAK